MRLQDRVSHRLKLRDLRLLLALEEWGSMAKAAAHLNLTQSAVSKAIAELEHTFGVRLFDRTPKGIEPTPYGRALLRGGVAVFDELRQSVNAIEHLADPSVGELRVGCTEPMSWGILPAIVTRLLRRHPRLVFRVTPGSPETLRYRELRERKIDLAIGRIAGPIPGDDADTIVLYNEKNLIVAGTQSRWARRRKLNLADLADQPWCLPAPDTSFAGSTLVDAFRKSGLPPPRINVESFSIPLANALITSGDFLGVLPHSLIVSGGALLAIKVLPIELAGRTEPVGIITSRGRTVSPVAQRFIDCARDITKDLTKKSRPQTVALARDAGIDRREPR